MPSKKKKYTFFFKITAVNLLVFFILLCFFELGLRLFWKMSTIKGEIYRASSNRTLRYELKPNLKTKYEIYEVLTNSDGFRGRGYSYVKDSGTFRIVMIGDSFTFGKYDAQITLPVRLENVLSSRCPGKRFEVLNMGVEGYNSIQELEVLKTKGLKYNPDLVVVYYCFNDPDYPEYYFKKDFFNHNFMFARYLQYRIKKYFIKKDRIKRGVRSLEDNFRYLYSSETWNYAKEAIIEMGDITQKRRIPMILLIAPEMSEPVKDFRAGYPFWYINDMLKKLSHPNIKVIDPVREFSRLNIVKDEIAHWTYPNAKGNDIIASYFIKESESAGIRFCQ